MNSDLSIRLSKFIADAGIASRRKAEELIEQGRITVNGSVVTVQGTKVCPGTDVVEFDGQVVSAEEKKIYILLNKPAGYVSTAKDQFGRPTVVDLIDLPGYRLYPVGRLDYDTSGLILLTNDGDLTFAATHPSHQLNKTYLARVEGVPGREALTTLREGVELDGRLTAPAEVELVDSSREGATLKLVIHEGRNRQVRNMCEAVGHRVVRLRRIGIGSLTLEGVEEGQWRYLSEKEVKQLLPNG